MYPIPKPNFNIPDPNNNYFKTIEKLIKITSNNLNLINRQQNYYTLNEYNRHSVIKSSTLNIISMNISSLNKHKDSLYYFIKLLSKNPDVIVLTETRTNQANTFSKLFDNYNCYTDLPTPSEFGGVAIFIKSNIKHSYVDVTNLKTKGVECVMLTVHFNKSNYITITGIYKHPYITIDKFEEYIHCLLTESEATNLNNHIITGDFNIDQSKYDSNNRIKLYFDNLMSKNLYQIIPNNTRITTYSKTLIDHIYMTPIKM